MKRTSLLIWGGLLACVLVVLAPALVRAGTNAAALPAPDSLAAAGQLYQRGDYALAAASYRQLVDQGVTDSRVFYNMGLAYARAGDLGQALWSLRSARALAPRDAETSAALAQVEAALAEKSPELAAGAAAGAPAERISDVTAVWLTTDELAWIALTLWSTLAVLLLVGMLAQGDATRRLMRVVAGVTAAVLLAAAATWAVRAAGQNGQAAIVVAPQAELRSGPGVSFAARTMLPAGAAVRTLEARGDWTEIELPGGATGWAPASAVAVIGG